MCKIVVLLALLISFYSLTALTYELANPSLEDVETPATVTKQESRVIAYSDSMYESADQSLFVLPTAYTMPKGKSAFTSYELVVVHLTKAITDRINIGVGMVFPFTVDVLQTTTVGGKVNYFKNKSVQCAAFGSITPFIKNSSPGFNIGHVISLGTPKSSFHIVVDKPFSDLEDVRKNGFLAAFGGISNLSERIAAIGELYVYVSDQPPAEVISLGVRFKGKNISWDFGGIRPLGVNLGGFLAVPFIKATYAF